MSAATLVLPTLQERSRKTLDALTNGAEALLRERAFEDISVAEICRAAGVTTGAFYARFAGKDALMPLIYERYLDWQAASAPSRFAAVPWAKLGLQAAGERVARILIGFYEERPWLLRAATFFARTRGVDLPSAPPGGNVVIGCVGRALAPHLARSAAADAALRFAAFAAMAAAREAVLFADAPAAAAGVQRPRLARDIGLLISGYLAAAGATTRSKKQ